jgi:hypothetical protein
MTVEEVKAELPNVLGTWQGKKWTCRVSGRKNKFATVSPWTRPEHGRLKTIIGPCFEVAWETVAYCVNHVVPITLD